LQKFLLKLMTSPHPKYSRPQTRQLLDAPESGTLKGKRDRAILSTLLFHGLRRAELCALKVRDITQRRGVLHVRVHGKGGKTRYVPLRHSTFRQFLCFVQSHE
jgi:integrase